MRRPWNLALSRRISPDRGTPLYLQLAHALIHEIERGRLQPGSPLPSSRDLAEELGLNRKTVVTAFEELVAQGWLEAHGRRGTSVATDLPETEADKADPVGTTGPRKPAYRYNPPPLRSIAVPIGSRIKLDEGAPDGSLFPPEILARAYRRAALSAARERRLGYRDPRGSERLRRDLAAMLREERGLVVGPENICVTRGSQAGISLATRVLARPGCVALAEELTYEPAVAAFGGMGMPVLPVRMDENGILVEEVERLCRVHSVCALFLTPHHQFPTTVSLPPVRRLQLIELARQFGFAIIEDDYDHEFRFGSPPLLPMASYAPDTVVYVGSLSKLLLPALRVGYIAAPVPVIDALAHCVSLTDGMGSTLTEDAVALLIDEGEVRRHARKVIRTYAERRNALAAAVTECLGDFADARLPDGGLAMWLRFHDRAALARIERGALDAGISFAASDSYRLGPDAPHGLRIGFASHPSAAAVAAIRALGKLGQGVTV
ncbi:MAG: PLP-dependent aminotransferase family protein [Novosphingobium sp.]|nr:PLP-dependent aminotransferase family protein [Novosphingobium sp.]